MEDAATAEISRAQVWQWLRHRARLAEGPIVDPALCRRMLDEEVAKLRAAVAGNGRYEEAARLFGALTEAPIFPEFLTIPAYDAITDGVA
jgi:malate synthase